MVLMMATVRIGTFYRITHRRFRSLPFKRRQLEGVPRCAHTVLSLSVHALTGRVRAQRRVCMGRWANSNGAHTLLARRFAQAPHGYATRLCACHCSGCDVSERVVHAYYAQMVLHADVAQLQGDMKDRSADNKVPRRAVHSASTGSEAG